MCNHSCGSLTTTYSGWHFNIIVCGCVIDVYSCNVSLFQSNVGDSSIVSCFNPWWHVLVNLIMVHAVYIHRVYTLKYWGVMYPFCICYCVCERGRDGIMCLFLYIWSYRFWVATICTLPVPKNLCPIRTCTTVCCVPHIACWLVGVCVCTHTRVLFITHSTSACSMYVHFAYTCFPSPRS